MKAALAAGLLLVAAAAAAADLSPALRALQDDETQNPAMLWVLDGEQRFAADCARCHTADAMRGVAARYPAWDEAAKRPVTLAQRINLCRQRHLGQGALAPESDPLLALEAAIARRSRGMPLADPAADARLRPFVAAGEALYRRRLGQLDLACAQCHDDRAGKRLAGSPIPQGHPTGYPVYRLEWQGMGSLQRRLRGCLAGIRAEPFGWGSDEAVALELYLKRRAVGRLVDAPGVRP